MVAQKALKAKQKAEQVVVEKAKYRELNDSLASLKLSALEASGIDISQVTAAAAWFV
eukprot:SAG22_NODE_13624_length_400_cov_0.850498_1_plen_56_part_10